MHRFEFGQLFRSKKLQAWAQEVLPLLESSDAEAQVRAAVSAAAENGGEAPVRTPEGTETAAAVYGRGGLPDASDVRAAEAVRRAEETALNGLHNFDAETYAQETGARRTPAGAAVQSAPADAEAMRAQTEPSGVGAAGVSIEEIDRLFRRDSRRYDSGFRC